MILTPHQQIALESLNRGYKENFICCLSGYAGTGKSTIIGEFVSSLNISSNQVVYLTYTGKASVVLQNKNLNSTTIHSYIYTWEVIDNSGHIVYKSILKQIDPQLRLIVIDEVSMVPDELFIDLFKFIENSHCKIICLGDLGQLPPVSDNSLISKKLLKNSVFNLEESIRFSDNSGIYELADRVRKGLPLKVGEYRNCKVVKMKNYKKYVRKSLTDSFSQIIVTTNKKRKEINNLARELLGHQNILPEVNEKVIFTRNNWDEMTNDSRFFIMNGLIGNTAKIEDSVRDLNIFKTSIKVGESYTRMIWVDAIEFIKYRQKDPLDPSIKNKLGYISRTTGKALSKLNAMDFAYAITVHKSQGSEFENVLFFAEEWGTPMFCKKLLYTGITRAIDSITIFIE